MVDNVTDPQPTAGLPKDPGSLAAAQDALLGLMDSAEKPEEENEASPSEEVTEDVSYEPTDELEEEVE